MAEPSYSAEVVVRIESLLKPVQHATQCVLSIDTVLDLDER